MFAISPAGRPSARAAFPIARRSHAAPRPELPALAPHVVAFAERSAESANAAWRAALVAHALGMRLHVVAVPHLHASLSEAARLADSLADKIRAALTLEVSVQIAPGTLEHEGARAALDAALVVVSGQGRHARWLSGPPALRLLRRTGRPVLAVRLPAERGGYRHSIAAVKPDLHSRSLIASARALTHGTTQVLHVLGTAKEATLRLADIAERTILDRRERQASSAQRMLADLIASAGAQCAESVVLFGDPGYALLQQQIATRADLLVVGMQPRTTFVDWLQGSVARRVMGGAHADVLVLPAAPFDSQPAKSRGEVSQLSTVQEQ